ncbi:MAG: DPP IV N-terminal domain-containing protein, partial [Gemmatimonadota bacterium]|nr:DPP IV N-terminal domain-containing protein [Gemmatimonadota bacterium]
MHFIPATALLRRVTSVNRQRPWLVVSAGLLLSAAPVFAQGAPQPDDKGQARANWTLANRFSTAVLREFTYTQALVPHFLGKTDSLWYNWKDRNGSRFVLMVPNATGLSKKPLFDAAKVAEALSIARRKPYDANTLPFTTLTFLKDHKAFRFSVDTSRYEWSLVTETLKSLGRNPRTPPNDEEIEFGSTTVAGRGIAGSGRDTNSYKSFSPDSTAFTFARNHNLYVVEVGKPDTVQVTTGGVEDWSFGGKDTTENRRQQDALNGVTGVDSSLVTRADSLAFKNEMRVRPNVTWSPDSKAFSIQRQDMRKVRELYLVNVLAEPRPVLLHYKYAMPGEENVGQSELWVYSRGEKAAKQLNVAKWRDQRFLDIHFPVSGDKVRLVRRDRTQRNLDFIEVDVPTGAVKTLLTDAIEEAALEPKNVSYLKKGGDFLWWSQKSGWGMYYVYDFNGGAAKRQLTTGSWNVERVARIDSTTGTVWVFGEGREPGEQLYQTHTYRVNGDGTGFSIVDPGDASHNTTVSPTKKYAYDTY